jgi:hypothetical protein
VGVELVFMLQKPVNECYVVVKFILMQNSENMFDVASQSLLFKFRGPRLHLFFNAFHIRYAHSHTTGHDGVTSNLYTFIGFNIKEFRIMAASIGGDCHVFKVVLNLI